MSLSPWFRLLLWCCLFSPLALSAQDSHLAEAAAPIPALENYFKESLNTRDGLPHNTINAIAQTPDGYLWFATWEGVARYNGREFKIYDRSPLTGLPDVGVRTFHLDRHQALWVAGSRGGLVKIKDGIWQAQPPLGVLINRVLLDSQDRLWLATEGKGLYRQNPDGSRTVLQQTDGLPSDQVYSLLEDQAGRIWIGTSDGLVFLDQQLQLQQPSAVELHRTPVFALTERENELLVGTERGLYSIATPTSAVETLLANVPVSALL